MKKELLLQLSDITEEEQEILRGHRSIDPERYYESSSSSTQTIDARKILSNGKIIDIRPHTRFVHFPKHRHNYIEIVYMAQGTTKHIIDGKELVLEEGDLLFMNQHAIQEIFPASRDDIAINFMILPQFFDQSYDLESNSLQRFLISCLTDQNMGGNYLYFRSRDLLPVQNIMETLTWIMLHSPDHQRTLAQKSMDLLFRFLCNLADHIEAPDTSYEQELIIRLLNYIETQYSTANLTSFADEVSMDLYALSRLIKKHTGTTFKSLLMKKRMEQSAFMLQNTKMNISDIAYYVGYENASYFYRLFEKTYHCSPRQYRINCK